MEKIRGVNLGSWLVLEKWMVPHLFKNIPIENEGVLTFNPQLIQYEQILAQHYDTFITKLDFLKIKEMGLNIVRIPVPHTMFQENSIVIKFMDNAFRWANEYDIKVLIDLHTVPGGQNGFDNSCNYQQITWDQNIDNVIECENVIKKIIKRYGDDNALYGIEPMNEPLNDFMFQIFKDQYTRQSKPINIDVLKEYYQKCHQMIKESCPNVKLIIHDGFNLLGWNNFMIGEEYKNVIIDTHLYLNFELMNEDNICLEDYLEVIQNNYKKELTLASKYHNIIVGEWSLGNRIKNKKNRQKINTILYKKQIEVYEDSLGWIFWSYKNFAEDRIEWNYELLFNSIIQGEN